LPALRRDGDIFEAKFFVPRTANSGPACPGNGRSDHRHCKWNLFQASALLRVPRTWL